MRRELADREAQFKVTDSTKLAFPYSLENSPTMKTAAQPPAPHGLTKLQHRLLYEVDSDDATFSSPSSTGSVSDYSDVGSVSSSYSGRVRRFRQPSSASSISPSSPLGSSIAIQRILMGAEPSSKGSCAQRHSVKSIASAFEHVSHTDQLRRPSASTAQSAPFPCPVASTSAMPSKNPALAQGTAVLRSSRKLPPSLHSIQVDRSESIPWHRAQAHEDEPEFTMIASPTRQQPQIPLIPFPSYRERDAVSWPARRGSDDSVYSNDEDDSLLDSQKSNYSLTPTADTSMSTTVPFEIERNRTPRPHYKQLLPCPKSADATRKHEQASADISTLRQEAQVLLASIRALTNEIDQSVKSNKDDSFTTVENSYAQVWNVMDAWHWSTWHMSSNSQT